MCSSLVLALSLQRQRIDHCARCEMLAGKGQLGGFSDHLQFDEKTLVWCPPVGWVRTRHADHGQIRHVLKIGTPNANDGRTDIRYERCKGFTLLELLVVMVIIGLLAGYVAPQYFGVVAKSEVKVAKNQIDSFQKALVAYRLDVGSYPSSEHGLAALVKPPPGAVKWAGPYLSKDVPLDPWGNAYLYEMPGRHGAYDILSYGRDGRPGGLGDDADIGSW